MAAEGYTFAKLPKCYLMPQLQNWIMYRQGAVFSETDKSIFDDNELRCHFFISNLKNDIVSCNFQFIFFFFCFSRKSDANDPYHLELLRHTKVEGRETIIAHDKT